MHVFIHSVIINTKIAIVFKKNYCVWHGARGRSEDNSVAVCLFFPVMWDPNL